MELDKPVLDAPAVKSIEGWVIVVTNLHEEVSEEDVIDFFYEFGDVKNIRMNLDGQTGYVKGYAFIEYATSDEAEAAVAEANGTEFLGRILEVDFAFVSPTPGQGAYTGSSKQRDRSRSPDR
ncbi:hypothetical protein TRVA0_050S00980 [Trichomonascus vanleenenianus]|uniref:uncharacterized protein n=1 Tax=Trichomonascus vanleenenianus TaxID=2268995 RepID=UPI003ECA50E1